jgi:UDP-galactose transporter B1
MNSTTRNQLRFAFCASGICCCYWFYGALQESLLSHFNLGATFLLVIQTVANIIIASVWRFIEPVNSKEAEKRSIRTLQHPLLFLTSSTYVLAMVASNESFRFVSYPTAVLAKSCKMIPTMLMGYIVEKKQYSIQQWTSALLITSGIASFNLLRVQDQEDDGAHREHREYWKGMLLLFTSLCMDGFLGSLQGILKTRNRPPTAHESMLFVNSYALILLLPMSIVSGQYSHGLKVLKGDSNLLSVVLLLNGVVSVGQIFIFLTITWYSSLVCTTITTTRKFFTILFSVIHFGHSFSKFQWVSICMVFSGLYLSIVSSSSSHHSYPSTRKEIKKD